MTCSRALPLPALTKKEHDEFYTSRNAQISVQTLLLSVLSMLMHLLPHLLLDPCDSSHSAVHHGGVHLTDAGARIEDLKTLLAVCDAACGEDDFRLYVFSF